jgi:hypothetical protein
MSTLTKANQALRDVRERHLGLLRLLDLTLCVRDCLLDAADSLVLDHTTGNRVRCAAGLGSFCVSLLALDSFVRLGAKSSGARWFVWRAEG